MDQALQFLAAIALVFVGQAVAILSFLPAFRHDWRRWRTPVNWRLEWPLMYPPLFMSGAMWSALHCVNSLGMFFVLRTNNGGDSGGGSHPNAFPVSISFWIASLGFWGLWAVPFEMETVVWSAGTWLVSGLLSFVSAALAYYVPNAMVGAILLSVYSVILLSIAAFNLFILMWRVFTVPGDSPLLLHRLWTNPLRVFIANGTWYPLYDGGGGGGGECGAAAQSSKQHRQRPTTSVLIVKGQS